MNYDMVDEIVLLAEQLIEIAEKEGTNIDKAKMEYERARELIDQGRKAEAVRYAVEAYETLYY